MLNLKTSCRVSPTNKVLGMIFNCIPSLYSWLPNYLSPLTRNQNISSIIGKLGWPLPTLYPPPTVSHQTPHLLHPSIFSCICVVHLYGPVTVPAQALSISWVFAIHGWCPAWFCLPMKHMQCGFDSWFRRIPWNRKWQPTPVFLLGESHGQMSLVDYSPWGCKELVTPQNRLVLQSYTGIASVIIFLNMGCATPLLETFHCLKHLNLLYECFMFLHIFSWFCAFASPVPPHPKHPLVILWEFSQIFLPQTKLIFCFPHSLKYAFIIYEDTNVVSQSLINYSCAFYFQ